MVQSYITELVATAAAKLNGHSKLCQPMLIAHLQLGILCGQSNCTEVYTGHLHFVSTSYSSKTDLRPPADPTRVGRDMFDKIFCFAKKHFLGQTGQLLRLCKCKMRSGLPRDQGLWLWIPLGLCPWTSVPESCSTFTMCSPNSGPGSAGA